MLDSSLEYLDLSGTSVSIQGLGYLRLLPKLKWINLANLDGQKDIEDFAGFIQEILPPNCYVNYSEGTFSCYKGRPWAYYKYFNSEETLNTKNLLKSGNQDEVTLASNILTGKDVEKLFGMRSPGYCVGTSTIEGRRRRKWLIDNYNQKVIKQAIKGKYYTKHAERFPPLL